ncbi:MAG: alpha-L-fucosidase [Lentisphaeria bacterium]|jgi:alpha-L-fucosidase|nr:alpha-L-fucosidase [Lentisphaeria bacterium]
MTKPIDRYNAQADAAAMNAGVHAGGTLSENIRRMVDSYEWPDDPLLRERLDWFMDQKLGLMIHWGLYSQWGLKESWPLVDNSTWRGDANWTRWQLPKTKDGREFKEEYANLHRTFNPVRFDPDEWADFAQAAGFTYLLFTTKHHDGFCMWDTKTTDYRITGPEVPFRNHRHADIVGKLYEAFRARGMAISVYFSKPDWMSPLYWEPGYLLNQQTRNQPSYDIHAKPELWEKFKAYMHEQIRELATRYGRIDCLWFDGGVISKRNGYDAEVGRIVDEARQLQPWILSADRRAGGPYENFITPELEIPETVLPVPWETCLCLGKKMEGENHVSFGYTYDQDYYSPSETLHILLEIVVRGGNLALNVAPQPDGRLPGRAMKTLRTLGRWLKLFGHGVYGTRPCEPYFVDSFRYLKKGGKVFVFRLYEDNEKVPAQVVFPVRGTVAAATYMRTGQDMAFAQTGESLTVQLPLGMVDAIGFMADGFELTLAE